MSSKMKVPLNLLTIATDPSNAQEGDVYFNTITKNIKIYNGEIWVDLTPASDDPTPFYMHTHNFDGGVHTIDIENPITFTETNVNNNISSPQPIISKYDGGSPLDEVSSPSVSNFTLLDGGDPSTNDYEDGGSSSTTTFTLLDGGTSQ